MKTLDFPVPIVDDERIQETYTELKSMQVVLDGNPIDYGPKRFNNRIAKVRAMLNRVEQLSLQASEDLHYFKRIINAKKGLYELEKRELMVKDPACRVGRSQGEREALADVRLRGEIEEIQGFESSVYDLETLMLSIKSKRTDLKDAQGRMRDQMKLIEHDISMGARWGNRETSSVAPGATSDLDSMLDGVDDALGWKGDDVAPGETEDGLLPLSEDEEEEDEEAEVAAPVLPPVPVAKAAPKRPAAAAKPKVSEPVELEPVIEIEPSRADEPADDFADPLEAAFAGKAPTTQFGDGELSQMSDVDTFLTDLDPLGESSPANVSPSDGIDDLIASLVND
jgi:hypothetical protein